MGLTGLPPEKGQEILEIAAKHAGRASCCNLRLIGEGRRADTWVSPDVKIYFRGDGVGYSGQ